MTRLKEFNVTITYPYQSRPAKYVVVQGINFPDAEATARNLFGGNARCTGEHKPKKMKTFKEFTESAQQLDEFAGPVLKSVLQQAAKQVVKQGGKQVAKQATKQGAKQGAKSVIKQTGKGLLKSPGKAPVKPPLKSPPKIAPGTSPKTTPSTSPKTTPATPGSKPGTGKKVAGAVGLGAAATGAITSTGNKTSPATQTQSQAGSGTKPPGRVGTTGGKGGGPSGPGKKPGGGFKMPNIRLPNNWDKKGAPGEMQWVSGTKKNAAKPK